MATRSAVGAERPFSSVPHTRTSLAGLGSSPRWKSPSEPIAAVATARSFLEKHFVLFVVLDPEKRRQISIQTQQTRPSFAG
jgi:hypothetical protein